MVKFLVESGACLFASTLSDHETPAEKCEEDEEGFDGCSEYLYSMYYLLCVYTRFCDKLLFSSNLLIRTQTDAHCCAQNGFAAVVASHHFQMNQIQI